MLIPCLPSWQEEKLEALLKEAATFAKAMSFIVLTSQASAPLSAVPIVDTVVNFMPATVALD
jgi:hypothetical protein